MHTINVKVNNLDSAYVSIITCTNRLDYMDNVFDNFKRQKYKKKQLIIILNNNNMKISEWKNRASLFNNIKVYQLDENISLGECLNFGVSHSDYQFIAKFDDDDFYGPKYLSDSIRAFKSAEAGIIFKASNYVYFEKNNILALRYPKGENRYVKHLDGPTMIIKREVFNFVKFRDVSRAEDRSFCKDCIAKGINIYSTNRFHHVYIRHATAQQHTWSIENKDLLKTCKIIDKNLKDYRKYVTRKRQAQIKELFQNIFKKIKKHIDFIIKKRKGI